MIFKYQRETLEHLEQVAINLEKVTNKKLTLKIGFIRDKCWNGNQWIQKTGDLLLRVNYNECFALDNEITIETYNSKQDIDYIRLDDDVYLKLNEFITEIYNYKRDNEQFHTILNKKLERVLKEFEK